MSAAIPFIMAGVTAVSAIAGFAQQRQAANAEQDAYNLQAANAQRQGQQEEQMSRDRLRKLLASQRALYAKAGVDLSSGSPLTVLTATAAEGGQEALRIRYGAQSQADVARYTGRQAKAAGYAKATTTLLSGLGSAAGMGYDVFKASRSPKV